MSGGMIGGGGTDPPTTTKGDISGFDTTFARVPVAVVESAVKTVPSAPTGTLAKVVSNPDISPFVVVGGLEPPPPIIPPLI